ncbi:hypothetical protein BJ875DRAFT_512186 [Amylocarpus encephaloides]|uniref:Uncharacterized protein n=1 Tax=Amylocarpus encephaloides TaxID=45428 RepID=A0A9P7YGF7_9HELO|nr:hypothetical protein BJ875DRAFT_512186 [Amylocarpus encephaloides]
MQYSFAATALSLASLFALSAGSAIPEVASTQFQELAVSDGSHEVVTTASALRPMFNPPVALAPQDSGLFRVWKDINYSGRYEALTNTIGYCYNLKNGWGNAISSAATGATTYHCTLWVQSDCKGLHVTGIPYSGFSDLRRQGINDAGNSYHCYY